MADKWDFYSAGNFLSYFYLIFDSIESSFSSAENIVWTQQTNQPTNRPMGQAQIRLLFTLTWFFVSVQFNSTVAATKR